MRFIHIADVHLGAKPDKGMPWEDERAQEIWDSFDRVLEAAKDKVDFLFIAGDLFHRQPLKRELKEINYKFEKLYPTRVVIIAGNHDYIGPASYYRDFAWADNVYFFKNQKLSCLYFEDKQTYIYGLSYEHYEIPQGLYDRARAADKPGCHILLAHGGDDKHIPINTSLLLNAGFDYIALGHIHKPEILKTDAAAYAGALEPVDRNDTGNHGYVAGIWENSTMHIRFVPFAKRSYIHLPVRTDSRMPWSMIVDMVKDEIERRGSDNIYKIILSGFLSPDIEPDCRLLERLGRVVEIEDNTAPDYDFDFLYEQNKDNIIGKYIERIRSIDEDDGVKKKALYYGIQALLKLK